MAHILVFGDSIAWGAWDPEGGWVERLWKYCYKKHSEDSNSSIMVYNLGISGDTSENALVRFDADVKSRLNDMGKEERIVLILSVGSNDSLFFNDKKTFWVPINKSKENITLLLDKAQKLTPNVFFVGATPVDDVKVDPVPWVPNASYKNEYYKPFNDLTRELCKIKKVPFIDIFEECISKDYKALLDDDGVHPNSEGHKLIFDHVKAFLVDKKWV